MVVITCEDYECIWSISFPEWAVSMELFSTEWEFYANTQVINLDFWNSIEYLRLWEPMNIEWKWGARYTIYNYKQKGPISFHIEYWFPEVSTPPLVPDWALNSVIWSVNSTVSEFIPYMVYIWFGVLSLIISFVGIKWLFNWLKKKIFSSFK